MADPTPLPSCTWVKTKAGQWLVRGPRGLAGQKVRVVNMKGTETILRLAVCVSTPSANQAIYTRRLT